jgi:hypothetical protein
MPDGPSTRTGGVRHEFRDLLQMESQVRLKELQHENSRLKPMYADLSLENAALKEVITKSSKAH